MRDSAALIMIFGVVTAAYGYAQVKLDPRLGMMQSVWLESAEDVGQAPAVAACFAQAISATTLLLRVERDKQLSQVAFRFRQLDRRVELSVNLHDGQQLLAVTAPLDRGGPAVSRECATAVILAVKLKLAMKSAHDATWYQPADDPPDEVMEAGVQGQKPPTQRETPEAPLAPPKIETRYDVSGGTHQVIEVNRVFWRFSWKMTVKNYGPDAIVVSPRVEFRNRNGLIVDTGIGEMTAVRAQDTVDITGTTLINASVAPSVSSVYVQARRIR